MIDAKLNSYLGPYFSYLAKQIIKLNLSANIITIIGFSFGLCCFYSIINFCFIGAFLFLILNISQIIGLDLVHCILKRKLFFLKEISKLIACEINGLKFDLIFNLS